MRSLLVSAAAAVTVAVSRKTSSGKLTVDNLPGTKRHTDTVKRTGAKRRADVGLDPPASTWHEMQIYKQLPCSASDFVVDLVWSENQSIYHLLFGRK